MFAIAQEKPTKRYFITDKLSFTVPSSFVNSNNKKYIVVINCRFFFIDKEIIGEEPNQKEVDAILTPQFISLHADFIHDERHMDSMVIFCNEPVIKRKKYEQLSRQSKINIWFRNIDGTTLDIKTDTDGSYYIETNGGGKRKVRFVLELLLTY